MKRLQSGAVHTNVPWYQRNFLVPGDLHSKMLDSLALDMAVAVETSERAEQARPARHACSAVPHSLSLSLSQKEVWRQQNLGWSKPRKSWRLREPVKGDTLSIASQAYKSNANWLGSFRRAPDATTKGRGGSGPKKPVVRDESRGPPSRAHFDVDIFPHGLRRPRTPSEVEENRARLVREGKHVNDTAARGVGLYPLRGVRGVGSREDVDWLCTMEASRPGEQSVGQPDRTSRLLWKNGQVYVVFVYEVPIEQRVEDNLDQLTSLSLAGGDGGIASFLTLHSATTSVELELGVGLPKELLSFSAQMQFLDAKIKRTVAEVAAQRRDLFELKAAQPGATMDQMLRLDGQKRASIRLTRLRKQRAALPVVCHPSCCCARLLAHLHPLRNARTLWTTSTATRSTRC